MAKAGACQELEIPAVVAVERYPKTENPILYSNGKGEVKCYMIPLFQQLDFGRLPFDLLEG